MRLSRQPFTIGLIALVGAAATMPLWASRYWILLCLTFCLYLSLAQMWNLLAGYCGLISLGQQTFIGLGGYTLAVLSVYYGFPLWMGVLCGGVTALVFALLTAVPIFRMRGVYFAVGTWLTAEVLAVAFSNWSFVRYGMGMFITPAYHISLTEMYYAGLVMGVGSTALVFAILRSKLGLNLMAMRDDEAAAQTVGVDVFRSKLYGFLIAAFVTGLTAGLIYLHQVFIQPYKAFGIDWTVRLLFIVIIGGMGTIEGPIVGAVIYVVLRQVFSEYLDVSLLLMGAVAIAVMTVAPKGIVGSLQERFGFEILSSRRT